MESYLKLYKIKNSCTPSSLGNLSERPWWQLLKRGLASFLHKIHTIIPQRESRWWICSRVTRRPPNSRKRSLSIWPSSQGPLSALAGQQSNFIVIDVGSITTPQVLRKRHQQSLNLSTIMTQPLIHNQRASPWETQSPSKRQLLGKEAIVKKRVRAVSPTRTVPPRTPRWPSSMRPTVRSSSSPT